MEEERVLINGEDEEKERLLDEGGVSVLDFDLLCSAVAAMQNQGKCKWVNNQQQDCDDDDGLDNGPRGGVLRMWEGDVFDCFDDHRIVLESCCCPWYRFGKNMKRAGFGFCFAQAIVYIVLAAAALVNITAFVVTRRHCFLYMGVAFTFCVGAYMGFHRMQIRKKFNIRLCIWSTDGWEKQKTRQLQIPAGRDAAPLADTRVQFHQDKTRLGWLIRFISHSVISGFTTSSAIVIALSQAKYFLGYDVDGSSKIIPVVTSIINGMDKMDKASVLGDAIKYLKQFQEKVKTLEEQTRRKSTESVALANKSSSDDRSASIPVEESLPEIADG